MSTTGACCSLVFLPFFLALIFISIIAHSAPPVLPLRTLISLHIYIPLASPVTSSPRPLSVHPSTSSPFPQDAPALFTCLLLAIFSYARSVTTLPRFLEFNSTDCCQNRSDPSDEDANTRSGNTIADYSPHTHSYLLQQRNRWN